MVAWQLILSNNGVLNTLLGFLHLPKVHIIYTFQAVLIGMVYDFLPFMILPIYNSLSSIGDDVVEAGKDLGASYFTILRKIIFPLSLPGVISGITMVFVPSMTSFVISNILGGSNTLLIGNIIEQEFTYNFNWNLGSGLSFVLLVFTLISMGLMSAHPSPLSAYRGFFGSHPFSRTNEYLEENGLAPIDWQIENVIREQKHE